MKRALFVHLPIGTPEPVPQHPFLYREEDALGAEAPAQGTPGGVQLHRI